VGSHVDRFRRTGLDARRKPCIRERFERQSTELVWTGPTTPFVSARRTEQALLQVIDAAKQTLFVTSFVAYDVSAIVEALNDASTRG
jgi:hypothetical protein